MMNDKKPSLPTPPPGVCFNAWLDAPGNQRRTTGSCIVWGYGDCAGPPPCLRPPSQTLCALYEGMARACPATWKARDASEDYGLNTEGCPQTPLSLGMRSRLPGACLMLPALRAA